MQHDHYRIVVALDQSEYAEIVLEHALDQAARHGASNLDFMYVAPADSDLEGAKRALGILVFDGLEAFAANGREWCVRIHVREGKPHVEILALASETDANLIVVGRFGRRLGSVAHRVLEDAPCPVLAVTLVDRGVEQPQCANCVAIRAETAAERWFCAEHSAPDRVSLVTTLPSSTWLGGGPLW
jgi:nucleotide-binding universal stress UspA family protein